MPAILAILVAVTNYHVLSIKDKIEYVAYFRQQMLEGDGSKSFLEFLISNLFRVYTLTYLLLAWRCLVRSKKQVASPAKKWFSKLLISGFVLVITITSIIEWFPLSVNYRFSFFLLVFSTHLFGLIYIYFNPPKYLVKADKYRKSGLTSKEENDLLQRLVVCLDEEEIFKDPLLTLPKLARQLGTNGHYLSQIINSSFNKSFNELINEYRVKKACVLLGNEKSQSVEEMGETSGFASASSFFRVFKKQIGQTPAQYRKSHSD
ncbi:MAG: AraC family transcriptional regulator [Ekhidna sp.]|nr:AraC family transcriptional regulator [Ekhidna sp.]